MTPRRTMIDECTTWLLEELSATSRTSEGSRFENWEWRSCRFRRDFLQRVYPKEGNKAMKRSVGVLGLLGLVYAVALPGASAAVLWQPDLSTGKLDPPAGSTLYIQGVNAATKGADDTTKDNPGIKPFVVITDKIDAASIFDNTCACDKAKGWLDNGDSDTTSTLDL